MSKPWNSGDNKCLNETQSKALAVSLDIRFSATHHPPVSLLMRCVEIIQKRDVI